MKKILLLLNFFTISIFAQFNENFDASTSLPIGWTQFAGANGNGIVESWKISSDRSFSGSNSAYIMYDAPGSCEDWLVTPLINIAPGGNPSLTFYGGQTYTAEHGNIYQIKISTTSQTNIASFATIATYSEADFDSAVLGPLTTQKTVDLSAYANQQIYIAFVNTTDDGDDFYVDNVVVSGTLGVSNFDVNHKNLVYPNPSNSVFNINKEIDVKTINIYGTNGTLIRVLSSVNSVDLSNLPSQVYFVNIEDKNGKTYFSKIVKI